VVSIPIPGSHISKLTISVEKDNLLVCAHSQIYGKLYVAHKTVVRRREADF